jgi:hypothetical protein
LIYIQYKTEGNTKQTIALIVGSLQNALSAFPYGKILAYGTIKTIK